jgi:hypothetical protein
MEEKITLFIDPVSTDGGLITNGKLMVGEVTVSRNEATDIRRRLDEYAEIKAKMNDLDGRVFVREKNKDVIISKFCADPRDNAGRGNFSFELGLLDSRDWTAQTSEFQDYLKSYRKNLYGR